MALRLRLAAFLVSLAGSISPSATGPDGDSPFPPEPDQRSPAGLNTTPVPGAGQTGGPDLSQEAAMSQLLETCARAFIPDGKHVRANVMTFTADGRRRSVHQATAFNMTGDADANLEMGATAGASGKAVLYRRAAVADLTLLQITSVPPWGLSAEEQANVRTRLRSILSVPIFHPVNANGPLLGTLQVDSDLTVEQAGFNKPEAAELMQQFADVLSLMMTGIAVKLGDAAVTTASAMSHSRVQNATQVEPGMYIANSSTSIFLISKARETLG